MYLVRAFSWIYTPVAQVLPSEEKKRMEGPLEEGSGLFVAMPLLEVAEVMEPMGLSSIPILTYFSTCAHIP